MGTTSYFERTVADAAGQGSLEVECGTTGYVGNGPQLFLKIGRESIILSHEDAEALCSAFARIAGYFRYATD
jgi:hypothetical protein